MRNALILFVAGILVAGMASAGVSGTKHDLGGMFAGTSETCVFCHTPHQTTNPDAGKQDPLWNHYVSTVGSNYGVYASDTLDADMTSADFGAPTLGAANVSQLCMSCHDGTVAIGSMYNEPNGGLGTFTAAGNVSGSQIVTNSALVGTDLTNDHPVNFTYNGTLATDDGGLKTPTGTDYVDAAKKIPLFSGKVQCASCHDPHDNTNAPFLVLSQVESGLCVGCHNK